MFKLGTLATDIQEQSEVVGVRVIADRCDEVVVRQNQYGDEHTVYEFNTRSRYVSELMSLTRLVSTTVRNPMQ